MLQELLVGHHEQIVQRTSERAAKRSASRVNDLPGQHGVPLFLRQLTAVVGGSDWDLKSVAESAGRHGNELQQQGFTLAQVVYGYGDVSQVVAELLHELELPISPDELRLFNGCLDEAIAHAVTEHMRRREQSIVEAKDQQTGVFAHELRNLMANAQLAFELVERVEVKSAGGPNLRLARSLQAMSELVTRSLTEVRLGAAVRRADSIRLVDVIEELVLTALESARAHRVRLIVPAVSRDLCLVGDRFLLASALANLIQNAMKFTRPGSTVTLLVRSTSDRVFVDVEDQCGGLPAGMTEQLFRAFEQRGEDRSGLGLGLLIARRAIEANGGLLTVRDAPGVGCVFTAELPRAPIVVPRMG